ncbi:MAG: DNA polymerase III subunit delta [Candidatus Krumholzibacteriia bacterium]
MARGSGTSGFDDLRNGPLKSGEIGPVYVLVGEDQLRIEAVVGAMKALVLDPAAAAFSDHVLYGDQATWQDVLQAAQGLSMFGGRQVVWLRRLEALDKGGKDDPGLKALAAYLADPVPSTVLILSGDKVDGRRAWVAAARKRGYLYTFEAPEGTELLEWIERAALREKLELDLAGRRVLADLVGNDLRALQAEIAKLALLAESRGRPLTAADLPELVMDQADLEVFALTDELIEGRPADVLQTWWRMQAWGSDAYRLTPLVTAHLRRVVLAAAGNADGASPDAVAAWTGLNGWMIRNKLLPHARRLGPDAVHALLQACLDCERTQKSRPIPPETAFEQLLLTVASLQEARNRAS